ncbi:restriction endonuclease [Peribacillus frigoritolerans]|uniref:restriction endonuclease n=1 Tax=Peribacillus castrilensis TaxID=2897690 RepID=UPI002DC41F79|nr:restriction endonuclease [Peribacillus castrilensis]
MEHKYRIGHEYVDKGATRNTEDQFLRWINLKNSGMKNMSGIRPLKYITRFFKAPAYLVLVTSNTSSGERNPWDDIVDFSAGNILYWGDAKFNTEKKYNDFEGNQVLEVINHLILEGKFEHVPPILHFSKPKKGVVHFNGLCIMEKIELTWFIDKETGKPIKNYRCHLSILDNEEVDVSWLHNRARATSLDQIKSIDEMAPITWKEYKKGKINKLQVWKHKIKSTSEQLPQEGTADAQILEQLTSLSPYEFEAVTVALFKQLKDVTHSITQTRLTKDGGFDFKGHFVLPYPLSYDIHFLGEAKKFSKKNGVQPKHISRLVARLSRGEYGIFVTTSFYTKQTQEEVYNDGYPIKLFSGIDLVSLLRELRLVQGENINKDWLDSVL